MKLTIVTSGSRGDIQPYIALATGLRKLGHDITFITNEGYTELINSYGFKIYKIRGDIREIIESEEGARLLESGYSVKFILKFVKLFKDFLSTFLDDIYEGCQDSEGIIYSTVGASAYFMAEKLGIPSIGAYLQPITKTDEFPVFMFPPNMITTKMTNQLSYIMGEQLFWQPVRNYVNEWIDKKLKLKKAPFFGLYEKLHKNKYPFVYGYSPALIPKPHDWSEVIKVFGFWFLEKQEAWQPPKNLVDFLESGPAPVYVGFGSMANRNPEQTAETIIKALKKSKSRGLLLSGWSGLKKSDLDDDIFMIDSVPHDWLFPKMSALVHHCGAGTTSAGLKAGIPSIPVPFFADQPFWAYKMYHEGLASKPIMRKDLNSDNLSNSITKVIADNNMQKRSKRFGEKLALEKGVEYSSDYIDNVFKNYKR